jgi:transposase-like protein
MKHGCMAVPPGSAPPMSPRCPHCGSSQFDTGIRTDPATGKLRKRCHCDSCGREFWRSDGIAVAQETKARG